MKRSAIPLVWVSSSTDRDAASRPSGRAASASPGRRARARPASASWRIAAATKVFMTLPITNGVSGRSRVVPSRATPTSAGPGGSAVEDRDRQPERARQPRAPGRRAACSARELGDGERGPGGGRRGSMGRGRQSGGIGSVPSVARAGSPPARSRGRARRAAASTTSGTRGAAAAGDRRRAEGIGTSRILADRSHARTARAGGLADSVNFC